MTTLNFTLPSGVKTDIAYRPRRADLSQLGDVRSALAPSGWLMLPDRLVMNNVPSNAPFWNAVGIATEADKEHRITVHYAFLEGNIDVPAVQKTNRPHEEPSFDSLVSSPQWATHILALRAQATTFYAQLTNSVVSEAKTSDALATALEGLHLTDNVTVGAIRGLTADGYMVLAATLSDPKGVMAAHSLALIAGDQAHLDAITLVSNPAATEAVARARSAILMTGRAAPDSLAHWLVDVDHSPFRFTRVVVETVQRGNDGNETGTTAVFPGAYDASKKKKKAPSRKSSFSVIGAAATSTTSTMTATAAPTTYASTVSTASAVDRKDKDKDKEEKVADIFHGLFDETVRKTVHAARDENEAGIMEGLAELVYATFCYGQLATQGDSLREAFIQARICGCRHNLYLDSKEVLRCGQPEGFAYSAAAANAYLNLYNNPNLGECYLVGALISFMESGHHSSAARLPEKMDKIASSIGISRPAAEWAQVQQAGFWGGTHPFSMRLLLSRCLTLAAEGNLSLSIARRLVKPAPGSSAYYQLEIVVEALANARFFELMDKEKDLAEFRTAMALIKQDNAYTAPYANYLYGKTAPDQLSAKITAAKLASLAADLSSYMTGTTLQHSPALRKLATEAAANSIVANLEARAFTRAYRDYLETVVRGRLQTSGNKPPIQSSMAGLGNIPR